MIAAGVSSVRLPAFSDSGAPCFDERLAAEMAGLGAPAFACTPDQFPGLMAAAIQKQDLRQWASGNDVTVQGA